MTGMSVVGEDDAFFLDAAERELVRLALAEVLERLPEQHDALTGVLSRLRKMAGLIVESPSISWSWGARTGRVFSAGTLIELLCSVPEHDLDLHTPTKAVLGQAFLVAKINFLKALGYTLDAADASAELRARVELEVGQSIYTKLAEELYLSIVTDVEASRGVREGAARFLFRIWEERLLIEVDDFAPVLESAWRARSKLLPVLGTMLGTAEICQLFREAYDPRFLDYFGEDHVAPDQMLAFEEFLFGLSHEEISRLRAHMIDEGRSCVSLDDARALLGAALSVPAAAPNAAQALYSSYKKRRVNAAHRALTAASGPKKTAEEYVMTAFLEADAAGDR